MVQQKIAGFITEEECVEILKSVYKDDAEATQTILTAMKGASFKTSQLKNQSREETLKAMARKEGPRHEYFQFMKAILDYQLRQYEESIAKFVGAFRSFDTDKDGIISEVNASQGVARL